MQQTTRGQKKPMDKQPTESRIDPALRETFDKLETQVQACLGGRVRDFHVMLRDGGLVLLGQTHTYYAKQLAQQRVKEASEFPILANDIVVE